VHTGENLVEAAMIKCIVRLKTKCGSRVKYSGVFKSTTDAVMDAITRFKVASICVEAAKS